MVSRKLAHTIYATQLPSLLASMKNYQRWYDWSVKYYEDMPDDLSAEEKLASLMHVKSVAEGRNLITVEYANAKVNDAASSSLFGQKVRADNAYRELTSMIEDARKQANFWAETYNSVGKGITPSANLNPEKLVAESERLFILMEKEVGL